VLLVGYKLTASRHNVTSGFYFMKNSWNSGW
jgi:hypothetical protein